MELVQFKTIEVPNSDITTQNRFINTWVNDMQRNGIVILSINPHPTLIAHYVIEYRIDDTEHSLDLLDDALGPEVDMYDPQP